MRSVRGSHSVFRVALHQTSHLDGADGFPSGGAIAAGTLDLPTGLETVVHVFVEDAGDYYEIGDGLPQRADGDHGIMIPAD